MAQSPQSPPPPHAFAQGVGTVFQFVGVTLFVLSMLVCCGTSLISKDAATHTGLTTVGWHRAGSPPDQPFYSAQRALTISLPAALCYGLALAALGLGLQSESPAAPLSAFAVNVFAALAWIVQSAFFISIRWIWMSILCTAMLMIALVLLLLSTIAIRDMREPALISK